MKSVGRIPIPGTLGFDLSFIREIVTPTGRTIRFVTNRKIAFGESYRNTQTKSFNLTAGEINIDDKDKSKSDGVLFLLRSSSSIKKESCSGSLTRIPGG